VGDNMDAKELFGKGQKLLVEGKLRESIDAFTKAIAAGEKSEIIFLSRGVAYFKVEEYDNAIHDFGIVININDHNFRAHFYRGTVFMAKEEYKKAIVDFDETIKLKPDYGAAFFARGTAYTELGNEDEAKKSMQTAITCSELSLRWVADHYGMFQTQFDRALSLISDEEVPPTMHLDDEQLKILKKRLEEKNK
jgi:tetratricopeptide (TPR) repeat protein